MRIVRIATIPFVVLHHLEGEIRALVGAGHEVFVVTSKGDGFERIGSLGVAGVVGLAIEREIAPFKDLAALVALCGIFRKLRPDLVHSITPKAGLLAALAGRLYGIPIRLHTFTGQAWAVRRGLVRWLGRLADRSIVRLNTRSYADSYSQRDFLVAEGICGEGVIRVRGSGSLAGVDLKRFDRDRLRPEAAQARARLGIGPQLKTIIFVGRVTRDKGIVELVAAFGRLKGAVLVLVGPLEPERDPLPEATLAEIERNPAIHAVGYDPQPERYLAFADLLCLPSYREGFGIVVIEAAALGVPCIGTDIVGLRDAVVNGKTGLLVPPKDLLALGEALEALLADEARRAAFGAAAREHARRNFDAELLVAGLLAEYRELRATQAGK
jgi:glycosyltransferase involved in cell wall biosynthesis